MNRLTDQEAAPFRAVLDAYNRCFLERDLLGLRNLYSSDGDVVYFDNHAGCDSASLEDHLAKVGDFLAGGKQTESGGVEPLVMENVSVFADAACALITLTCRYASTPVPGVRSTFVLQKEAAGRRIRHIHFSFDPNE